MSSSDYPESFEKWWTEVTDPKAPRVVQAKDYAFMAWQKGIQEFCDQPANTVEAPAIQHILSRDQRDALVAANVLLSVMQSTGTTDFHRIQMILDEISDMLYDG